MTFPLPSKYFPIHCSTTILPFDADIIVKGTTERIRTWRPKAATKGEVIRQALKQDLYEAPVTSTAQSVYGFETCLL